MSDCEGDRVQSHDSQVRSEVKIEIDVAEDMSLFWTTEDGRHWVPSNEDSCPKLTACQGGCKAEITGRHQELNQVKKSIKPESASVSNINNDLCVKSPGVSSICADICVKHEDTEQDCDYTVVKKEQSDNQVHRIVMEVEDTQERLDPMYGAGKTCPTVNWNRKSDRNISSFNVATQPECDCATVVKNEEDSQDPMMKEETQEHLDPTSGGGKTDSLLSLDLGLKSDRKLVSNFNMNTKQENDDTTVVKKELDIRNFMMMVKKEETEEGVDATCASTEASLPSSHHNMQWHPDFTSTVRMADNIDTKPDVSHTHSTRQTGTKPDVSHTHSTRQTGAKPDISHTHSTRQAGTKPDISHTHSTRQTGAKPDVSHTHSTRQTGAKPDVSHTHSTRQTDTKPDISHTHSTRQAGTKPDISHTHSTRQTDTKPDVSHTHSTRQTGTKPDVNHSSRQTAISNGTRRTYRKDVDYSAFRPQDKDGGATVWTDETGSDDNTDVKQETVSEKCLQQKHSDTEANEALAPSVHLRIQRKRKSGKGPYVCSTCNKTFKWLSYLKIHTRQHTGEKPYSCTQCEARFQLPSSLKVHMRKHTGERPYGCTECGKTFIYSSYLVAHKRTHTGEKPYSCTECDKAFAQSGSLRVHQKTHRAHPCTECDQTFMRSCSLREHKRKHIGEKSYSCPQCDMVYVSPRGLKQHTESKHNTKPCSFSSLILEWSYI